MQSPNSSHNKRLRHIRQPQHQTLDTNSAHQKARRLLYLRAFRVQEGRGYSVLALAVSSFDADSAVVGFEIEFAAAMSQRTS